MPPQGLSMGGKPQHSRGVEVNWGRYAVGGAKVVGVVAAGAVVVVATKYLVDLLRQRNNSQDDDLFSEAHAMPKYAVVPSRNAKNAEADKNALEALMRDIGGDEGAENLHYLDELWEDMEEEEGEEEYELEFQDSVEYIHRFFGFEALNSEVQHARRECLKAIDATLHQITGAKIPLRNQFTGQVVDTEDGANEEFEDVISNPDPVLQVAAAVEVSLRQRILYIAKQLGISLGGKDLPAFRVWSLPIPEALEDVNVSMQGLLEVAKEYLEICIEIDRTKEQTVDIQIEKATAEEGYGEWALRTEAFKRVSKQRRGFMDINDTDEEESQTSDTKPKAVLPNSRYLRDPLSAPLPTPDVAMGEEEDEEEDEEFSDISEGMEELHDTNRRSFEAIIMREIFKRVATEEQRKEFDSALEEPLHGFVEPYLIGVEEDDDDDSRIEALIREEGGDYENDLLRRMLARNFEDDEDFDHEGDDGLGGTGHGALREVLAHNFYGDHGDDDYAHEREDALYEDVGDEWVDY